MVGIDFRCLLGQWYTILYTTLSTIQRFASWFLILSAYVIIVECTKFHIKEPYESALLCERRGWPYAFFAHCTLQLEHRSRDIVGFWDAIHLISFYSGRKLNCNSIPVKGSAALTNHHTVRWTVYRFKDI